MNYGYQVITFHSFSFIALIKPAQPINFHCWNFFFKTLCTFTHLPTHQTHTHTKRVESLGSGCKNAGSYIKILPLAPSTGKLCMRLSTLATLIIICRVCIKDIKKVQVKVANPLLCGAVCVAVRLLERSRGGSRRGFACSSIMKS